MWPFPQFSFYFSFSVTVDVPSSSGPIVHEQPASEPSVIPEATREEAVIQETVPGTSAPLFEPAPMSETPAPASAAREDISEPTSASQPSASPAMSGEGAMISNLKNSLQMASEFESRLRDLTSQAKAMKTNMHVSTYVSFLPTGCSPQGSE